MAVGQQSGFKFSGQRNTSSGFTMPNLREAAGVEKKAVSSKKADSSDGKNHEQKWDHKEHKEKTEHQEKSSYLSHDKEITLKIKPRKLVEASVLILMFVAVFYLGRFSADPAPLTGFASLFTFDTAGSDDADEADAPEVKVKEAVAVPEDEDEADATDTADADADEDTADAEETDTTEVTVDAAAEETAADEGIVTTYTHVTFAVEKADFTWKETWGKIDHVGFVLVNKEDGPIKVDHLGLLVEGYGDFEKKVPISSSIQVIDSMKQLQALAPVPSGFPYNAITAGDLTSVTVTLVAYDADNKEISRASTTANLQG